MQESGFHDLLRQAQGGDQAAMERLLSLLRPYLERTAEACLDQGGVQSASDIVQESWLLAWSRLGQFAGGRDDAETLARFRAWTARIVRNVCLQSRRNRRRKKRLSPRGAPVRLRGPSSTRSSSPGEEPTAGGSTPSAGVRRAEEARRIHEAIDRLSDPEERDALRLRFFAGLTLREVAERLGLSYDAARERLHRGMARLGGRLRERP